MSYQLLPIGRVVCSEEGFTLEIDAPYRPALKQLEHFSHVNVLWWANQHDNPQDRSVLQSEPPYAPSKLTGVFASRSEYRPNPIAVTTCQILHVDEQAGRVLVT